MWGGDKFCLDAHLLQTIILNKQITINYLRW